MRKPIDGKSLKVYDFIVNYIDEHGSPPLQSEMKDGLKISQVTLNRQLEILQFRKYIELKKNGARGITIL